MRAQARRTNAEDDDESAFVSMTDMTVGFLFVVMILLAFFASQFKTTETVPKDAYDKLALQLQSVSQQRDQFAAANLLRGIQIAHLEALLADQQITIDTLTRERNALKILAQQQAEKIAELERNKNDPLEIYMGRVAQARRQILERMRDGLRLDFPDLQVQLSEQSDALRFQGDGLFVQGSDAFTPGKAEVVKRIAQRLNDVLPCYTFGGSAETYKGCNPNFAVVEAVQVEGHTDSSGPYKVNINLSAARATTTFLLMTETLPTLRGYKNLQGESVISFSGYGPDRPIVANDNAAGMATNRRIDLRLIMLTPQSGTQVDDIRRKFVSLGLAPP
jgi:flagellar motor protein MotB